MKKSKRESNDLMKEILRRRFTKPVERKRSVQPLLEESDINRLIENFNNENEIRDFEQVKPTEELLFSLPPLDKSLFMQWKHIDDTMTFERSYDIWRQFYITLRRSDLVIIIVDSRDPQFFFEDDIKTLCNKMNKKLLILLNKADLLSEINTRKYTYDFEKYVFYSTKNTRGSNIHSTVDILNLLSSDENIRTIGLIGYPNVGKSSFINNLLLCSEAQNKKAKVSMTPGKTKFAQQYKIEFNERKLLLVDCPGLVFRRHTKEQLALKNILNVDQSNLKKDFDYLIEQIGIKEILIYFNLGYKKFINDSRYPLSQNFFNHVNEYKGWDRGVIVKKVVKAYFDGKLRGNTKSEEIEKSYEWLKYTY